MSAASPGPAAQLLPIAAEHAPAVRALFEKVFGHALSEQEWRWKYQQGAGLAVGLWHDGELVAHYGGLPRDIRYRGQIAKACQVCDVMVESRARSTLSRRGPLYQITAGFLEAQIGYGLPHLVGFGFPAKRHFAAADRLRLYGSVDTMVAVGWPAARSGQRWRWQCQALTPADLADSSSLVQAIAKLWQGMIDSLPALTIGVRNVPWLRYRYLAHPRFRYELLLVRHRWTRRPLGLAVVRRHEHHLEWVDLIAPTRAWPALLAMVRNRAHAIGLPMVEAWISQSQHQRFMALSNVECTVRDLEIDVPANVHTPGPTVEELSGRWFLMAGDTDFR